MKNSSAKLYVVATPIGNLDDMSMRARNVLAMADVIAAEDSRQAKNLINSFNINTPIITFHDHSSTATVSKIIAKLTAGQTVALISDRGTPLISDPGYELVTAAIDNNIAVCPIPGPSAVTTALSVAALPTDRFYFAGFLPAKSAARQSYLQQLADIEATLVLFESVHRIQATIDDAITILGPNRKATLARELTKQFESIYHYNLQQLSELIASEEIPVKGEFVLIIQGQDKSAKIQRQNQHLEELLPVLLDEIGVKSAVKIACKLTGLPKNLVYQAALAKTEN